MTPHRANVTSAATNGRLRAAPARSNGEARHPRYTSLGDAAATWVLYLALESYARRLHPRFLVSWNRLLLRGRYRDPLVGRDVLAGVALSTIVALFWLQLPIVIPHALGSAAPPPPMWFPLGGLPFCSFSMCRRRPRC